MPTYDYRCAECGHEMEYFQSMSDRPIRKCPECGRLKLRRLMGTGAGVIFKGSGFYETDYKRKTNGAATRTSSTNGTSSSKSSDSGEKKESKAETKTPAKTSEKKDK